MAQKQVQVKDRFVVANTIKWSDWEDLVELKKERVTLNQFIKACLNREDADWWTNLEYNPDDKELLAQRDEVVKAVMEVNARHFPKQEASQGSTGASGAQSIGSQKPTGGP